MTASWANHLLGEITHFVDKGFGTKGLVPKILSLKKFCCMYNPIILNLQKVEFLKF